MVIKTITLKAEIEKAIVNREENKDQFYTDIDTGYMQALREILRRIDQFVKDQCSICGSKFQIMPKAGSGVESHFVCLKCVKQNNLEVLPEYLENIENIGHWHNALSLEDDS